MDNWMDGDIESEPEQENKLTPAQIDRLIAHNETLRVPNILGTVTCIKDSIMDGDLSYASQLWGELSEDEQTALWIAPKYGGIFTTEERKIIKNGFKD